MAMVKNNEQLTVELNLLANRVQGLADSLENMMPEMKNKILASETATEQISNHLKNLVNPLSSADLISRTQIMHDRMDVIDGNLADASRNLTQQQQLLEAMNNKVESVEAIKKVLADTGTNITALQTEAHRIANESTATKSEAERRYAEMQSQLITASTMAAGSATGGGGGRKDEPFVTHKLIMNKERITGDEDFTIIDEWLKELYTDVEIIMPGAKLLMVHAEKSKHAIDDQFMLRHENTRMLTTLSRELFVIFSKKTMPNSKARFELNGLSENQGLEVLRRIRMNLCKREGPRLQDEYEASTTLPRIKEGAT